MVGTKKVKVEKLTQGEAAILVKDGYYSRNYSMGERYIAGKLNRNERFKQRTTGYIRVMVCDGYIVTA